MRGPGFEPELVPWQGTVIPLHYPRVVFLCVRMQSAPEGSSKRIASSPLADNGWPRIRLDSQPDAGTGI